MHGCKDAAYCYRCPVSVCLSVCWTYPRAVLKLMNQSDAVRRVDSAEAKEPWRLGPQMEGHFLWKGAMSRPIENCREYRA